MASRLTFLTILSYIFHLFINPPLILSNIFTKILPNPNMSISSRTFRPILQILVVLLLQHSLLSVDALFGWGSKSNSDSKSSSVEQSDNSLSINFQLSHQHVEQSDEGTDDGSVLQAVQQQQPDDDTLQQQQYSSVYSSNGDYGTGGSGSSRYVGVDYSSGGYRSGGYGSGDSADDGSISSSDETKQSQYSSNQQSSLYVQSSSSKDGSSSSGSDDNRRQNSAGEISYGNDMIPVDVSADANATAYANANANANANATAYANENATGYANANDDSNDANQSNVNGSQQVVISSSNSETSFSSTNTNISSAGNDRQQQQASNSVTSYDYSSSNTNAISSNSGDSSNNSDNVDDNDDDQRGQQIGSDQLYNNNNNSNTDTDLNSGQQSLISPNSVGSNSYSNYSSTQYNYSVSQNSTQNGGFSSNSQQSYQNYSSNTDQSEDNHYPGNTDGQQQTDDADFNQYEQYTKTIFDALDQSKEQTKRRQARARLAAIVQAISVLLWEGYDQLLINNGSSCSNNNGDTNGASTSSSSRCTKPELDDVALQLSQNEFGQQLGQTVDGNGPNGVGSSGQCISAAQVPTTGQIVAMITMYSHIYGLINGDQPNDAISISDSSTDAEITNAIGTIMRRTSKLQQQLQSES